MPTLEFLNHLSRKLKTGNLRSIHLNALPSRYATRLDLNKLSVIDDTVDEVIDHLHLPNGFSYKLNFDHIDLNFIDDEVRNELNFIAKKLNGISFQDNDNYLEHGIRTFGLGYPLLIKKNKQDPSKIIKAPIFIWRLNIVKSNRKTNEWVISRDEDLPISVNPLLISYLNQDEGIEFHNEYEEELSEGISSEEIIRITCSNLMAQLNHDIDPVDFESDLNDTPTRDKVHNIAGDVPWINWSGVLGLYRSQKESIINEIEGLIENYEDYEFEDLIVESFRTSTISCVDTDPSQEEIINNLTLEKNRIIQGPPGTGKSQSLSAIITNTIENGGQCLVVCEKKTALDVLYNNLKELGLEEFCAVIDDVNKDRRKIIDKAREIIDSNSYSYQRIRSSEYNTHLVRQKALKSIINEKHAAVKNIVFGDDNLKDLIGKFIEKGRHKYLGFGEDKIQENLYDFTYEEFLSITERIQEAKEFFEQANPVRHPMNKLTRKVFEKPFSKIVGDAITKKVNERLKSAQSLISQIENDINLFDHLFLDSSKFNRVRITALSFFSKRHSQISSERQKVVNAYNSIFQANEADVIIDYTLPTYSEEINIEVFLDGLLKYENLLKNIQDKEKSMREYYNWRYFTLNLNKKSGMIIKYLNRHNPDDWVAAFESWYFGKILSEKEVELGPLMDSDKELNNLSSLTQSLKKNQLKKIRSVWNEMRNRALDQFKLRHGNIKSLYNYKKNKQYGRRNSLRKILHTDFDLFTSFFPVLLINPVVASSILPLREGIFEIVLFDEASQLRLEDTYTSYIRGKYKIISGDVHQMPPSNYFGSELVLEGIEDDEENGVIDDSLELADKESLLMFGEDSGFRKSYLDFHYRSKHPDLIEFSNAAFYGSRLTPMPPRMEYKALRFVEVNGLYESNRTNPAEAKKIVELLFTQVKPDQAGDYPSVGIGTFNIEQRNLILEMIQDECFMRPDNAQVYDELKQAGLFVKNLENIQGDERDIIILSTTFGLNNEGKFRQSFGPINQAKGYKLLNVIITRAKYKLYICTSIPREYYNNYEPGIIQNGNVGKSIMYAYLAYVRAIESDKIDEKNHILELLRENCNDGKVNYNQNSVESPFEQEVYDYLTEFIDPGRVEIQYSVGGFRIDFVIKSSSDDEPIIALECDGATYHSSEEAYSHDLYRQKLIEEEFGLNFYRIWSTNWWRDPVQETNKLVQFINEVDDDYSDHENDSSNNESLNKLLAFTKDDQTSYLSNLEVEFTDIISVEPDEELDEEIDTKVNQESVIEPSKIAEVEKQSVNNKLIVTIKNLVGNQKMKVQFTKNQEKIDLKADIKVLHTESPLALALLNHRVGEKIKVAGIEVYYEILEIQESQ